MDSLRKVVHMSGNPGVTEEPARYRAAPLGQEQRCLQEAVF